MLGSSNIGPHVLATGLCTNPSNVVKETWMESQVIAWLLVQCIDENYPRFQNCYDFNWLITPG